MAVYRYIFFAEEKKLKTYLYNEENNNFKLILLKSKEHILVDETVWNLWKEEISFNDRWDFVDFCFICDKKYDFIKKANFKKVSNSVWNNNLVEEFLKKNLGISNIKLINIDDSNEVNKENTITVDNSLNIFYTNIKVSSENSLRKTESNESEEKEISRLAEFFIDKMNTENT